MKSAAIVKTILMVLVWAFCLIIWNGFSEAWAKGPGAHVTTSRIAAPGNVQGSPGTSSGNSTQDNKTKGTGAGKIKFDEFSIKKTIDSASPSF
jgi:hypothetical protein